MSQSINKLPEQDRLLVAQEILNISPLLRRDVKTLSTEERTSLLSALNKAESEYNVKVIQLEAQRKETQKQLQAKEQAIKEKHGVSSLEELKAKKEALEQELNVCLFSFERILQGQGGK